MLSGVRMEFQRHRIDRGSLITVACDYTSEAQEAIRKGTQTGSVVFPLGGKRSVEAALKRAYRAKGTQAYCDTCQVGDWGECGFSNTNFLRPTCYIENEAIP